MSSYQHVRLLLLVKPYMQVKNMLVKSLLAVEVYMLIRVYMLVKSLCAGESLVTG